MLRLGMSFQSFVWGQELEDGLGMMTAEGGPVDREDARKKNPHNDTLSYSRCKGQPRHICLGVQLRDSHYIHHFHIDLCSLGVSCTMWVVTGALPDVVVG